MINTFKVVRLEDSEYGEKGKTYEAQDAGSENAIKIRYGKQWYIRDKNKYTPILDRPIEAGDWVICVDVDCDGLLELCATYEAEHIDHIHKCVRVESRWYQLSKFRPIIDWPEAEDIWARSKTTISEERRRRLAAQDTKEMVALLCVDDSGQLCVTEKGGTYSIPIYDWLNKNDCIKFSPSGYWHLKSRFIPIWPREVRPEDEKLVCYRGWEYNWEIGDLEDNEDWPSGILHEKICAHFYPVRKFDAESKSDPESVQKRIEKIGEDYKSLPDESEPAAKPALDPEEIGKNAAEEVDEQSGTLHEDNGITRAIDVTQLTVLAKTPREEFYED